MTCQLLCPHHRSLISLHQHSPLFSMKKGPDWKHCLSFSLHRYSLNPWVLPAVVFALSLTIVSPSFPVLLPLKIFVSLSTISISQIFPFEKTLMSSQNTSISTYWVQPHHCTSKWSPSAPSFVILIVWHPLPDGQLPLLINNATSYIPFLPSFTTLPIVPWMNAQLQLCINFWLPVTQSPIALLV